MSQHNEDDRLKILNEYGVMDTPPEEELDSLTKLASVVCNTPIALISLLDHHRQWFKSNVGLNAAETPRNISFCQYAIEGDDVYEVYNAAETERFAQNPLVTGYPNIRFYAGAPLINPDGYKLGTLCVIDTVPKQLDEKQKETLRLLSQLAINHFELQRKKNEVEKSRAAFHTLVERSGDIIYTSDHNGAFTFINQKVEDMLGYKPTELVGKNFREIIIPEWQQKVADFYTNQFKNMISETKLEFPVFTKNGQLRWIEQTVSANIKEGLVQGFNGVVRDVTDRKTYETELLETKKLLTQALSIGRMGSFENNVKTQKIIWSKEIYEMMDMHENSKPLSYEEYLAVIHPEDLPQVLKNIEKTIVTKKPDVNVNRFLTAKKRVKWIETRVVPMFDANGDLMMFRGTMQDITDQKELEKLLITAKEMAEQSVIAKEQFLANMSHEIRTPMNAVLGYADLLAKSPLNTEQKEYVHSIQQSGKNLMSIINDILDYSKIEAGMMTLEETPLSIRSIFSSLSVLFGQNAKEKDLELKFISDEKIPEYLLGDPPRLTQIIVNLVSNAIKFTTKGSVMIHAVPVAQKDNTTEIKFTVSDTGIGIPAEKQGAIFERFNQATNSTTRQYGGTGLGLSIVKKLVEIQGGNVVLNSTEGKGSVFEFNIVFKNTNRHVMETVQPSKHEKQGKQPRDIYILLVEDNIMNQKLAQRILQNMGYQVEIADNGKIAVDKVMNKPYDLVLMDMQMPVMDGYEAAVHIRKTLNMDVPIIAMTAHAMLGEKEKCLGLGMNDYISKPFNPEDLQEKIILYTGAAAEKDADKQNGQSKTPHWLNLDGLMKISGGDKTFINEMLNIFVTDTPPEIINLREAVEKNDYPVIQKISHKLISSVALVGLKEKLLPVLQEMEELGKNHEDIMRISKLFRELEMICTEAFAEARQLLEN